ncbi:MAG: hypothetical protein RLZZ426_269, partial [Actinomycetota bacterium]
MSENATSVERTVAGVILDLLWAAGVRTAFGIPGVHNLAFWNAAGPNRPRIVGVRHEQTTVYAADGLARATGGLGVALTTTGPGAANTLGAFGEAAVSGSPVLVISSEAPIGKRDPEGTRGLLHEMDDQASLFEPLAKQIDEEILAVSVTTAEDAVFEALRLIQEVMQAPRGSGYLGIPADILEQPFEGEVPVAFDDLFLVAAPDVDDAIEELESVQRIIIWAGGGAVDNSSDVEKLSQHWNAPVLTTFAGRGIAAHSPNIVTAPIHEPEVESLFANADALVVIGSDLDGMNTKNWNLPWPSKIVVINIEPTVVLRNIEATVVIDEARIHSVVESLINKTQSRESWADVSALNTKVRDRLRREEKSKRGIALVEAIENSWPHDANIVCDMSVCGYWVGVYANQNRSRRISYPVGWGTLGFGLPAAIGPAAQGIRTLAVCGDGGVAFALGELATIAQEKLPYTLLIVDDG